MNFFFCFYPFGWRLNLQSPNLSWWTNNMNHKGLFFSPHLLHLSFRRKFFCERAQKMITYDVTLTRESLLKIGNIVNIFAEHRIKVSHHSLIEWNNNVTTHCNRIIQPKWLFVQNGKFPWNFISLRIDYYLEMEYFRLYKQFRCGQRFPTNLHSVVLCAWEHRSWICIASSIPLMKMLLGQIVQSNANLSMIIFRLNGRVCCRLS